MFTFKWLAVPSICAALLFAPASPVLAETGTHKKKTHKVVVHKPTAKKKTVAEMAAKAAKPSAKVAQKSAKKKVVAMNSKAPAKSKKHGKRKTPTRLISACGQLAPS